MSSILKTTEILFLPNHCGSTNVLWCSWVDFEMRQLVVAKYHFGSFGKIDLLVALIVSYACGDLRTIGSCSRVSKLFARMVKSEKCHQHYFSTFHPEFMKLLLQGHRQRLQDCNWKFYFQCYKSFANIKEVHFLPKSETHKNATIDQLLFDKACAHKPEGKLHCNCIILGTPDTNPCSLYFIVMEGFYGHYDGWKVS